MIALTLALAQMSFGPPPQLAAPKAEPPKPQYQLWRMWDAWGRTWYEWRPVAPTPMPPPKPAPLPQTAESWHWLLAPPGTPGCPPGG